MMLYGGYFSEDGDASDEESWILSSGARGLSRLSLPLVGKDDESAVYTVRLHFSDDQVVVDIHVQGQLVSEDLDSQDQVDKSLLLESVEVSDNLVIDLLPKSENPPQMPILTAIEVVRTSSL